MTLSLRTKILLGGLLFLLLAIPLTLSFLPQQQDLRSRAAGGTSLSLIPQPGPGNSIQKTVGDNISVDVFVDPAGNAVATARMQIKYDVSKLQAVAPYYTPYVPSTANAQSLPNIIDGPISSNGMISVSVTSGFDTTKAVTTQSKIGTFFLKAIGTTPESNPASITFTNLSQAYSVGSGDQAAENILTSTNQALINIVDAPTQPTTTPTTTPSPAPGETTLSYSLLLHGMGEAGDTPNPNESSLSNKNPRNPQRNVLVEILDATDQIVKTITGTANYNVANGTFDGSISLGQTFTTGNYTVKIKSDRYLRRSYPGIITITHGQNTPLPTIELVTGDTNKDNAINILDYNALLDCGYGSLAPLPITNSNAEYNSPVCKTHEPRITIDLDDNGFVNAFDYNLFLRELSVQSGD